MADLQIELVQSPDRLREITGAWENALARSVSSDFFLLPEWLFAWWDLCGLEHALFFVCIWGVGGALHALFPLCRRQAGPVGVLFFAGTPRYSDRLDFILDPTRENECLDLFTEWLYARKDWDVLTLRSFGPLTDHPERFSETLERHRCRHLTIPETFYAYIPTGKYGSYDVYLERTRSAHTRRELRRVHRRMEEKRGAQWEWVSELSPSLIDEMAELDQHRTFRGAEGRCFFCRPMSRGFLLAVAGRVPAEHIRTLVCRAEGKLIAFLLCFDYNHCLMAYQSAYDSAYHQDSLGSLTLLTAIRHAFENGYREFDFLSGDESYKNFWAEDSRQARRLHAYRKNWRATLIYAYHRWVKPVRRRLSGIEWIRNAVPGDVRAKLDI